MNEGSAVEEAEINEYRRPSQIIVDEKLEFARAKYTKIFCPNYCRSGGICTVDVRPKSHTYVARYCKCPKGYSGPRCEFVHIQTLYQPSQAQPINESEGSPHGSDNRTEYEEKNIVATSAAKLNSTPSSSSSCQLRLSISAVSPVVFLYIIIAVAFLLTFMTYRKIIKRKNVLDTVSSWTTYSPIPRQSDYYSPSMSEEKLAQKYRMLEEQFSAQKRLHPEAFSPAFRPICSPPMNSLQNSAIDGNKAATTRPLMITMTTTLENPYKTM